MKRDFRRTVEHYQAGKISAEWTRGNPIATVILNDPSGYASSLSSM